MTRTAAIRFVLALLAIGLLTGCGKIGVQSPDQQSARERKAAGVTTFRITCSKDLWDKTKKIETGRPEVAAKSVTDQPGATVIVELSGPAMVDYLQQLDRAAHPGSWDTKPDQIAVRMYNAIAPVVDAVQEGKPATAPVSITLSDTAPGAAAPSTATTATVTPSPARTTR